MTKNLTGLATAVAVLAAVYLTLRYLVPVLVPFLVALLLALVIDAPVRFLERRTRLPRGWAVAVTLLALLAVMGGVSWLVVSRLVFELEQFSRHLPLYQKDAQSMAAMISGYFAAFSAHLPTSVSRVLSGELGRIYQVAGEIATSATGTVLSLPGTVLMLAVALVAAFFMSRDKDAIQNFLLSFLPGAARERALLVRSEIMSSLGRLLRAQFILVFVTTVLTMAGLAILGSPYAILLGIVAGLLDFLPYLGPSAIFLPWIAYNLLFGHPAFGVQLLVLLLVLGLVRQLIEARIIGGQLGIHPLAILLALYVGVELFGAWGFVLGPVSAVVLKAVYRSGALPWPRREEAG